MKLLPSLMFQDTPDTPHVNSHKTSKMRIQYEYSMNTDEYSRVLNTSIYQQPLSRRETGLRHL